MTIAGFRGLLAVFVDHRQKLRELLKAGEEKYLNI